MLEISDKVVMKIVITIRRFWLFYYLILSVATWT